MYIKYGYVERKGTLCEKTDPRKLGGFIMKFDENGNLVSKTHQKTHHEDSRYVGLESRQEGISDAAMNVALDMVHDDRTSDFYFCLQQMEASLK